MLPLLLASALATSAGPFSTDRCTGPECSAVSSVRVFRPIAVAEATVRIRERVRQRVGPIRRLIAYLRTR